MKLSELIENYKRIAIFCDKTSTKSVILELQGLKKSQKPVVQQFVADWYEENKDDFEGNLFRCVHNIPSTFDGAKLSDFERWFLIASTKSFQILVNMHQFGYEVEKEERYRVRFKGLDKDLEYLNFKHGHVWVFSDNIENEEYRTAHTRKQLEEADFGWVFDCPGIEIEEAE